MRNLVDISFYDINPPVVFVLQPPFCITNPRSHHLSLPFHLKLGVEGVKPCLALPVLYRQSSALPLPYIHPNPFTLEHTSGTRREGPAAAPGCCISIWTPSAPPPPPPPFSLSTRPIPLTGNSFLEICVQGEKQPPPPPSPSSSAIIALLLLELCVQARLVAVVFYGPTPPPSPSFPLMHLLLELCVQRVQARLVVVVLYGHHLQLALRLDAQHLLALELLRHRLSLQ